MGMLKEPLHSEGAMGTAWEEEGEEEEEEEEEEKWGASFAQERREEKEAGIPGGGGQEDAENKGGAGKVWVWDGKVGMTLKMDGCCSCRRWRGEREREREFIRKDTPWKHVLMHALYEALSGYTGSL